MSRIRRLCCELYARLLKRDHRWGPGGGADTCTICRAVRCVGCGQIGCFGSCIYSL